MTTIQPLDIIIVEKNASLKLLCVKDFKEEELYKKCGFKKADDFTKQTEWTVKMYGIKYLIQVYAKTEGRANNENKYDFPPPIDTKLFFGNCAIVAKKFNINETGIDEWNYVNLTLDLWQKLYEKLFGGFEDLNATAQEDEDEIDELKNVAKEKKTKNGYLKDGFVVDSDEDEDEEDEDDDDEEDDDDDEEDTEENDDTELNLEDCGSELSEEDYDYSLEDDEEEK